MKRGRCKIISYFLLSIILLGINVNLHVYSHLNEGPEGFAGACKKHDHDDGADNSCKICLLTTNLNNLDYFSSSEISIEHNTTVTELYNGQAFLVQKLHYKNLFLNSNRNKAPPYLI